MTYESKSLYQKGHSNRFTKGKSYGNADEGYPQNDGVLPHHLPVLSTKRPPCLKENGCLLNGHGKWAGGGMRGRDQLPSDLLWVLLEQAVLGIAPSHGFQLLLNFHWWVISGEGLDVMPGSAQAEDARIYMAGWFTLKETDSWLFPSCFGQKRKNQEKLSQGQLVLETFQLFYCPPTAFRLCTETYFPKTQEKWFERGAVCPLAPSLWSRAITKTQCSPFLPSTLGLPYLG